MTSSESKLNSKNLTWYMLLIIGLILVILFFISRLTNLTLIPIFTDEAIYLRWAQIALGDAKWRFISLTDGKQPLLIWLFFPAMKLISDPLIAGRTVSVIAGFFAMSGLAILGKILTKSNKGLIVGAALYLVMPFFLMYDRLALYDALFGTITVWALIFIYLFGTSMRLGIALILGTIIGAGLLTKSYAYFFLILHPLTLLLIPWKLQIWKSQFLKWSCLSVVIFIQSQVYLNILRLSEFRHYVGGKNLQFIYSPKEFLSHPLLNFWGNFKGLGSWLVSYITIPLGILIVVFIILYLKKDWKKCLFFISWFAIPFLALAFFGKVIYPRFLLFMVFPLIMPLIIMIVDFWIKAQVKLIYLSVGILAFVYLLFFNYQILFNPIKAPIPEADRMQFFNDWPAGYGIKEVIYYLDNESKKGSLIIATEGTFGLFPMAIELYLGQNPNITTKPYWPLNEWPKELSDFAKTKSVYLLFKERQQPESGWPIELIQQYKRGDGNTYLKFYRVLPKT